MYVEIEISRIFSWTISVPVQKLTKTKQDQVFILNLTNFNDNLGSVQIFF